MNTITLTSELTWLTVVVLATSLMWIPYLFARITTNGLTAALGNPDPSLPPGPAWAQRARRAHKNAVENLAVFAPLVLAAALTGTQSPATAFAAKLYCIARLVHYVVYVAGIPVVRTLAFIAGFAATLVFALAILGHVA